MSRESSKGEFGARVGKTSIHRGGGYIYTGILENISVARRVRVRVLNWVPARGDEDEHRESEWSLIKLVDGEFSRDKSRRV